MKNYIYDQNSDIVDQQSGNKYTVPSVDGELVSEDTGVYTVSDGEDVMPLKVTYASEDAETSLPTSRYVYDENSQNSSEATEGVRTLPPQEESEPQEQEEEQEQNTEQNTQNQSENDADSNKGNKENGKEDKKETKKNNKNKKKKKEGGSKGTDKEAQTYDATGEEPDLPDVGSIAAYGPMAAIVQMVGGQDDKSPLAAADDVLLDGSFATVFADEGSRNIVKAFTADDQDYKPSVSKIISAKPDTVLVYNVNYFSKKERAKLAKADISITTMPKLTSSKQVLAAVKYVAKMLSKSTDGLSVDRYDQYKEYHDALVSSVQGSKGYACYNGTVLSEGVKTKTYEGKVFTSIVTEWDYKATFKYKSVIDSGSCGIGLVTTGYRWSPVSYYLGVGGVINNASAMFSGKTVDGQLAPLWQYNTTQISPLKISYKADYTRTIFSGWTNGFTQTTLVKANSAKNRLNEDGFGTEKYPALIFASKKMAEKFKSGATAAKGLYRAYGQVETEDMTFYGFLDGGAQVFTTVSPDVNLDEACLVNPHGLFSSWIDGSAESCLESAWVASQPVFSGDWNGSVEDEVTSFYKKFYRYDLSGAELDQILEGSED